MAGDVWDAPNQQVVRGDESAPWEEGDGGTPGTPKAEPAAQADDDDGLDEMTKNELLDEAERRDLDVSSSMTKDELKEAIRGA